MGELVRIAPHDLAFRFIRDDMRSYPYSDGFPAKAKNDAELEALMAQLIDSRLKNQNYGFYTLGCFPDVGYIGLLEQRSTYPGKGKKICEFVEVLGIYVNPHHRLKGCGGLLLATATKWARQRGKEVFVAWVHEGNQASLATFKKAGFTLFNADEEGRCYAERWL